MSSALTSNHIFRVLANRFRSAGRLFLSPEPVARPVARIALLVVIVISAAGCGRDKPEVAAGQTLSPEELKQKCADQQWREKNLGIWYAVCRQPVSW
jgi:hypothetical protein